MPTLDGKVAIVTGVSSGIGLALAAAFLASGTKVLGVDRQDAPKSIVGKNFAFLKLDLLLETAPDAVVKACTDAFGERIDILINNAGIMDNSASADTVDDEIWANNIAINLTVPVMLMRAVLPMMKQQRSGSIVNISSKAGISGACSGIAYCSAKHGINGATKNVAFRFRNEGIRCNSICPGGVATNITDSYDHSKKDIAAYKEHQPIHNVHVDPSKEGFYCPSSEDMVGLTLFLAGDLSKTISGSIIPIDLAWSTI